MEFATDRQSSSSTGTATAVPVADAFIETLIRVMPRLGRIYKSQLRDGPLTPQQMFVLMEIQEISARSSDGAQPRELARHCSLSSAGVTAVVDDLVDGGFCVRAHGEKDRRAVFVRPTAHGVQTLAATRQAVRVALRDGLGGLLQQWGEDRTRAALALLEDLDAAADAVSDRLRT